MLRPGRQAGVFEDRGCMVVESIGNYFYLGDPTYYLWVVMLQELRGNTDLPALGPELGGRRLPFSGVGRIHCLIVKKRQK